MSELAVTKPAAGDTLAQPSTTSGRREVDIAWTTPDAIRDRPVVISLVQGNNVSTLSLTEVIDDSAPNNGSYTWSIDYFDDYVSGCNYSIQVGVWSQQLYSGYFTYLAAGDSRPINRTSCPMPERPCGPGTEPCITIADLLNSAPGRTGVTTTTLAIAIVIPIVALLSLFALVIYIGTRKGWFVSKRQKLDMCKPQASTASVETDFHANGYYEVSRGELGGDSGPVRIDGREVYQLPADERVHT